MHGVLCMLDQVHVDLLQSIFLSFFVCEHTMSEIHTHKEDRDSDTCNHVVLVMRT